MKAFFDMMDKDPRKVMILGGSCTSVTDYIAKTSKHWRIPVVTPYISNLTSKVQLLIFAKLLRI